MGIFSRSSQATVDPKWNDPALGLSESDFKRWPGRYTPKRTKMIERLEPLLALGTVQLPVRLIGQCTAYGRKDGHPAHPQMIYDLTDFVVTGSVEPSVITFHKGPEIISGFDPAETLIQNMTEYVDLQFLTSDGAPCGRIGFYTGHGHEAEARSLAHLVGAALMQASGS